jgi:hypothetical protein
MSLFKISPVKDLTKNRKRQIIGTIDSDNTAFSIPTEHVLQVNQFPNKKFDYMSDYLNGSTYQTLDDNVDGRDRLRRSDYIQPGQK